MKKQLRICVLIATLLASIFSITPQRVLAKVNYIKPTDDWFYASQEVTKYKVNDVEVVFRNDTSPVYIGYMKYFPLRIMCEAMGGKLDTSLYSQGIIKYTHYERDVEFNILTETATVAPKNLEEYVVKDITFYNVNGNLYIDTPSFNGVFPYDSSINPNYIIPTEEMVAVREIPKIPKTEILDFDVFYAKNSNQIDASVMKIDDKMYISLEEVADAYHTYNHHEYFYFNKFYSTYTVGTAPNYSNLFYQVKLNSSTISRTTSDSEIGSSTTNVFESTYTFDYKTKVIDDKLMVPIDMIPYILPVNLVYYPNQDTIVFENAFKLVSTEEEKIAAIRTKEVDSLENINITENDKTQYLSISNKKIYLGDTIDSVNSKLGNPDRSSYSSYGFDWYFYNTDDYVDFIMVGVEDNLVVGLYTTSKNAETANVKYGDPDIKLDLTYRELYHTDPHNGNKVYAIQLSATNYTNPLNVDDFNEDDVGKEIFDVTNGYRVANGLSPLKLDSSAERAAKKHSEDMGENLYFSHTGLNGSGPWDRYIASGGSSYTAIGENISSTSGGISSVASWIRSYDHRKNILYDYTHLGAAAASGGSVQVFIRK